MRYQSQLHCLTLLLSIRAHYLSFPVIVSRRHPPALTYRRPIPRRELHPGQLHLPRAEPAPRLGHVDPRTPHRIVLTPTVALLRRQPVPRALLGLVRSLGPDLVGGDRLAKADRDEFEMGQ